MPYVDAIVLRKQLLDKVTGWGKWKITEAEADYIVGKLGGHMGDIDLVGDALSKGEPGSNLEFSFLVRTPP